ncbi:MAG: 9-O-acetylesterase [Alistipes sp.]|nr:9-O-acetylesterase [Alistipes sp.]
MKTLRILILSLVLSIALLLPAAAKIELCPLFTDNMVLQQKSDAPVWGKAEPNATITVTTSWNKASYTASAEADGKWMVKVRTPKAGGPYTMTISEAGESITLKNILIGEVWLCSGQSNMQMPVSGSWAKVTNHEQEVQDAAKYPKIRLIGVERMTSSKPEDNFTTYGDGWMVCSPESIAEFSATAYFFGREIHLKQGVPVGLIHSSWGGTVIEAWMTKDALQGVKDLGTQAEMVSGWPVEREERRAKSQGAVEAWNRLATTFDAVYAEMDDFKEPKYDDSRWDNIKLPGNIEQIYRGFDGHVLVRKSIDIPAEWAGKSLTMRIQGVDDKDVTYFNGQKIGENSGWNRSRSYTIPAELVKEGKVIVAIRIMDTSGNGGIPGNDQSFYIEDAEGKRLSLAGEWKSKREADYSLMPAKPVNMYNEPYWSTVLYNAMISPLVPYAIKGAIWYQGCSNDDRAYQYQDLMKLLIADWRAQWGYNFPFYITQLANYTALQTKPTESTWAELREAQTMAAQLVPNTGMAVTIDIGEAGDIHPRNKQEVGRRLALQALNKTYGMAIECSGPMFDSYEVDGEIIRIKFSSTAKGLVVKGDKLEGFTIAGADHKFHWAEAKIVGDCVEVSCKDVPRPLAVRYAWAHNPLGNLYNTAGLPASPFRTDSWQGITISKTSRY